MWTCLEYTSVKTKGASVCFNCGSLMIKQHFYAVWLGSSEMDSLQRYLFSGSQVHGNAMVFWLLRLPRRRHHDFWALSPLFLSMSNVQVTFFLLSLWMLHHTEKYLISQSTSSFSPFTFQMETEWHRNQSQIWISLQPFWRQPPNQPSEQRPRCWNISVPRLQFIWDHCQPRGQSNLCM